MRDDRGVSLVELLVAFAVSAIVITMLGGLLFFGLRLYGRNTAHTEVLNEAQTTMNLIVDTIMESQGICMHSVSGIDIECVLLGDLQIKETGSGYDVFFKGKAIVTDIHRIGTDGKSVRRMYLVSFPNNDFRANANGYAKLLTGEATGGALDAEKRGTIAAEALNMVQTYTLNLSEEEKTMWLLARYITGCSMKVDHYVGTDSEYASDSDSAYYKETKSYKNGANESFYYYEEPVTVNISIALEYDYGSGRVTRNLENRATIRSRVDAVYIGDGTKMYEYVLKK